MNKKDTEKISASGILRYLNNQITYLILIIIVIGIIATVINPNFLTLKNFFNILQQTAILGIMTMAMSMLMISGGVDISIGSMAGCIGMIFTLMLLSGINTILCIITALVLGSFFGFVNGIIIAKTKVSPIITTLGMNYVFYGLALIIGKGRPYSLGENFGWLTKAKVFGYIPVSVIMFIIVFIFSVIIIKFTTYGRRLGSIGTNNLAAYLSGINVELFQVSIYTLSGLITGFASLVLVSRLGMISPDSGENLALQCLAAAIIGGISIDGGKGSLTGAFFGTILLGFFNNAMNIIGITSYAQIVAVGAIIVIATSVTKLIKK